MWEWLNRELGLKAHQVSVLETQIGGSDSSRVSGYFDSVSVFLTRLMGGSCTERWKNLSAALCNSRPPLRGLISSSRSYDERIIRNGGILVASLPTGFPRPYFP